MGGGIPIRGEGISLEDVRPGLWAKYLTVASASVELPQTNHEALKRRAVVQASNWYVGCN